MNKVLALSCELIKQASITPEDAGCQEILIQKLNTLGFDIISLPGKQSKNFWARKGTASPLLVFAGHTDVVTPGHETNWAYPPFEPTIKDGYLYGRGAADMKSALAAMVFAVEEFLSANSSFKGSIGLLITSAEEGPSEDGTPIVLDYLQANNIQIDYCIVGEPTSHKKVADTIKIGRRGSLTGKLTLLGTQGHIAYPHLADNPIHKATPILQELITTQWDEGNKDFQATCFQVSNIHAGTGAGNVIPGEICIDFNLRYSPETSYEKLQTQLEAIIGKYHSHYRLNWTHYGKPYHTVDQNFINLAGQLVREICDYSPEFSTTGGTSDARYIAQYCSRVIELGVCNNTIHQVNECVLVEDIIALKNIYFAFLKTLLAK